MAVRRVLIVMDDDSEAQLLVCDHTQDCDNNYPSSQIIEVVMGRGARFDLYDMEESSAKTARYSQLFARQEAGSSLLVNGITPHRRRDAQTTTTSMSRANTAKPCSPEWPLAPDTSTPTTIQASTTWPSAVTAVSCSSMSSTRSRPEHSRAE